MANLNMSDIRQLINTADPRAGAGTLPSPLIIILIGRAAQSEEDNFRRELPNRWNNAGDYLHILSILEGDADRQLDETYTRWMFDRRAIDEDNDNLYNRLTTVAEYFAYGMAATGHNLADSTLIAVVNPEDSAAQWVTPLMCLLNQIIYESGGTVLRRHLFVFQQQYHPRYAPTMEALQRQIARYSTEAMRDEIRYVAYDNGTFGLLPCDDYLSNSVFDRVIFLADVTDLGGGYEQCGGRFGLFSALIDPESEIAWPVVTKAGTEVFTGFVFPRELESSLDVVLIWKYIHASFLKIIPDRKPDLDKLKEINKRFENLLSRICTEVRKQMRGFSWYDIQEMDNYLSLPDNDKPINVTQEKKLFGNALKNKYDHLWITLLHSAETQQACSDWEDAITAWLESIWSYEDLAAVRSLMTLDCDLPKAGSTTSSDMIDAESVRNHFIERNYAPWREENARKLDDYLEPIRRWFMESYERRLNYLRDLRDNALNELEQENDNVIREFTNELKSWYKGANTLIDDRRKLIGTLVENSASELLGAYETLVNRPDKKNALAQFIETIVRKYLKNPLNHVAPTVVDTQQLDQTRIACRLTLRDTFIQEMNGSIARGKDSGRVYVLKSLGLYLVQGFNKYQEGEQR